MYEVSGASLDRGVVVLNDIHIDIVDYIHPAACSDADFRRMWAEFEWENKVCSCHPYHTLPRMFIFSHIIPSLSHIYPYVRLLMCKNGFLGNFIHLNDMIEHARFTLAMICQWPLCNL